MAFIKLSGLPLRLSGGPQVGSFQWHDTWWIMASLFLVKSLIWLHALFMSSECSCLVQEAQQHHDAIVNNAHLHSNNSSLPPQFMQEHRSCRGTLSLSSSEFVIVMVLLPVALQTLLQTNLPASFALGSNLAAPVMYCLLLTIAASFLFLLLCSLPESYNQDQRIICATHTCFCLVVLAMVIAIALRAIDNHATPNQGKNWQHQDLQYPQWHSSENCLALNILCEHWIPC